MGWIANLVVLTGGRQDAAVPTLLMLDDVQAESALGIALRSPKSPVVALYPDLTGLGIPTVRADAERTFRVALSHLSALGHKHIALVSQRRPEPDGSGSPAWQREADDLIKLLGGACTLAPVEAPLGTAPIREAHDAMCRYLARNPDTTAFITQSDELAYGVLAACRTAGRCVPEDMSLINIGDSMLMEFSMPPVTCVDTRTEQQVMLGLTLIESGDREPKVHWVEPRLIERDSVRPCKDTT